VRTLDLWQFWVVIGDGKHILSLTDIWTVTDFRNLKWADENLWRVSMAFILGTKM